MAENSNIEWTDHTFNPWRGCQHATLPDGTAHPGCDHCYAEAMSRRNPATLGVWGEGGTRVVAAEAQWKLPVKWNAAAEKAGVREKVFCASLADVFEDWPHQLRVADSRPAVKCHKKGQFSHYQGCDLRLGRDALYLDEVRLRLFSLIDATPWLDWILLTKRPENVRRMWPALHSSAGPNVWVGGPSGQEVASRRRNVWLLTSVSDQQTADAMVPELLECCNLVPVLGLSCEPLLGPIDLTRWLVPGGRADWQCQQCGGFFAGRGDCPHCHAGSIYSSGSHAANKRDPSNWFTGHRNGQPLDWVIVGGESGPNARPCDVAWIRSIVAQCKAAGVPCFVKQLGARPIERYPSAWPNGYPHGDQSVVLTGDGFDTFLVTGLRDKKGGDWNEWPDDLRVRQFPEATP